MSDADNLDELRDELPHELNAAEFQGAYEFPDNSRRRVPAYLYFFTAVLCLVIWLVKHGDDAVLVNEGLLIAAGVMAAVGLLSLTSSWRLGLDEKEALARATGIVGFPIGHASAQMSWRGLRSRPIWRILAYSSEEPPTQRAFVIIDAVDGSEIEHLVEDNPEDWAALTAEASADA